MKFRKKPVVIEAFQWNEHIPCPAWFDDAVNSGAIFVTGYFARIQTLEGLMTASPGDWIVRGVEGEIYPVKPSVFEATYEPVKE